MAERLNSTLLLLLLLSLATVAVAGAGWPSLASDVAILAMAAIKGRRIALDYLGLRAAPPLWRALITVWLALLASLAFAGAALPHLVG